MGELLRELAPVGYVLVVAYCFAGVVVGLVFAVPTMFGYWQPSWTRLARVTGWSAVALVVAALIERGP